jgi:hypothetical protein
VQTAPASHSKLQWPGTHVFVQFAPAAQTKVHPPPLHELWHVELASQVKTQPPPAQANEHVLPAAQSKGQLPPVHSETQDPEAQLHEPSSMQAGGSSVASDMASVGATREASTVASGTAPSETTLVPPSVGGWNVVDES